MYHLDPKKCRNASLYSTSSWKSLLFGTLLIVLAMCKEHREDNIQTKINVDVVGMIPLRTKVAGKFNMAGPVKELMAMAMEPSIPIEPKEREREKKSWWWRNSVRQRLVDVL